MIISPVKIIPEMDVTPQLDEEIKRGLVHCFPEAAVVFSHSRAWHGSGPAYSAIIEQDGAVIAHLGVVERRIRAGAQWLSMAGVQNVFVLPAFRKLGLVDRILVAAMEEALRRGIDAGLLFCLPLLEKVYARCGWQTVRPGSIRATDESGHSYYLDDKNIMMFHPLGLRDFPSGDVDLNGNDW